MDQVHYCPGYLAFLQRTRPQDHFKEALAIPSFGVARCGCQEMSGGALVNAKGLPCVHCACLVSKDPRRTEDRCPIKMKTHAQYGQRGNHCNLTGS